jgi:serine/threonine-protein kinase
VPAPPLAVPAPPVAATTQSDEFDPEPSTADTWVEDEPPGTPDPPVGTGPGQVLSPAPPGYTPSGDTGRGAGPATDAYEPGDQLGAYRILEVLGEGGMGKVYRAEHARLGRKVALKLLRARFNHRPDTVRRFFDEARAVNQIAHENIVQITDFIEHDGGPNYYIMELLTGESLAERLARGMPTLATALGITIQTCSALSAIHEVGIVHRDVKPDNIFLTERFGQRNFVKLLDFGIAKLAEASEEKEKPKGKTNPGAVVGTPEYMSPEQAAGRAIDHRSDIYCLGLILYEMATGKRPLQAQSHGEWVIQHMTEVPTPPSQLKDLPLQLPEELDRLIVSCLEKDPDKRPQSAAVFADALRDISARASIELEQFVTTFYGKKQGGGDQAPEPEAVFIPAAPGEQKRRRAWPAVLAVLVLLTGGGALAWLWHTGQLKGILGDSGKAPVAAARKPDSSPVERPKVAITLDSIPQGAAVFRSGGEQELGRTPLTLSLERSDQLEVFEFKLDGHAPALNKVPMLEDGTVLVTLTKIAGASGADASVKKPSRRERLRARRARRRRRRRRPKKRTKKKKRKTGPSDTIDPF